MEPVKLQSANILSANAEKAIEQKIEQLKELRDEKEIVQGVNFEAKDPKAIERKIAELEKVKREQGVPQISSKERDRAVAEIKLLQDDLRQDMPTWDEYVGLTPKAGARYTSLVQKIVKWEQDPIRKQKVQRWKTLRRILEPDNPMASSMTYLFPQ